MTLPELSIHRHVFTYMMSAAIILFGLISYQRIGIDRFPNIEFPMISISTALPGASPEVIDTSVTNIIESAVNSIPGIEHIQSSSSPGISTIRISFTLKKNVDAAFNEVQAKINQVNNDLPQDTEIPIVAKVEIGADPILWLVLEGDRTLQQLNQYVRNTIKKRLETIDGVGEVQIGGKRERTIRVNLNIDQLTAYQITSQDILVAFEKEHIKLSGGYLVSQTSEKLINLDLEFHSIDTIENMLVAYREGSPIRIKDIATVKDALSDLREIARFDGKPGVGIGIIKVTNSNTVAIVDAVLQRIDDEILPNLPPSMTLTVASNNANVVKSIVNALKEHLIEGTLLAALVVWLFLRSIRATLIISMTIPVSLFGAITVLYFSGYTFNIMTLLGLLLLIGVVVDDAIVVLENVYRHRQTKESDPVEAAIEGSNQVVFAVLAASFTLMALFATVIFMEGIIGRFLQPFAVTVTVGVLVSLFVSVTLTPMLCSRNLGSCNDSGFIYNLLEKLFLLIEHFYKAILGFSLKHRVIVLLLTSLVVSSPGFFFSQLGKGFMPEEDIGRFIITFKTPLGSNIDYTSERLTQIEARLSQYSQIKHTFSTIGSGQQGKVSQGSIFVTLTDKEQRSMHQSQLIVKISQELNTIPGIEAFASPVPVVGGQRGEPLQFVLQGPNLLKVAELAEKLKSQLDNYPELGSVDMNIQLNLPQLRLKVDRILAADLGISTADIAMAVNLLAGGIDIAKYNDEPGDGERYDIRLKAQQHLLTGKDDLSLIYLRGKEGEMIRLDTIAHFEEKLGAETVSKFDLQYAATFFATPTTALDKAIGIVETLANDLLPPAYSVKMIGRAEEFGKTMGYLIFAFVTGTILVYMGLASQFNSFIQPLIIMIAQPLAIIGGVAGLWLTGHSLNIYSMIGLVLLVGLVAKNSILLIDLTNQLRAQGESIQDALLNACPIRMRPVLMTSLTMILALLPAAFGLDAGSDTNGPLAVAVIGGMTTSTLVTLVVVPVAYSLVEQFFEWFKIKYVKSISH
ncbi:MAG: efflux RND transporter permease subunit [gamma proteobacterium symbiont of Lucinoma myriamae]|nr:efflux RND transporter permease subunit [gamma proteobacterium symbiont of Lucinoma myriamae]MCU7832027.1 efflux RND transporter permease subunit [gamma proteobacterium symbiont of Lucinoma myriamae]